VYCIQKVLRPLVCTVCLKTGASDVYCTHKKERVTDVYCMHTERGPLMCIACIQREGL
jgi:hypothetical protein